jgi:hypothetical protein
MSWVQTFTGRAVRPLDLQLEDVCIEDIAHSLSLICRFNGHCREFYSVANHSSLCAMVAPDGLKLKTLLHDAAEYLLQDITRPFKAALWVDLAPDRMVAYRNHEMHTLRIIFQALGVAWPTDEEWGIIRGIDNRIVMTELRDLLSDPPAAWGVDATAYENLLILPMSPGSSEQNFLHQFRKYKERGV